MQAAKRAQASNFEKFVQTRDAEAGGEVDVFFQWK